MKGPLIISIQGPQGSGKTELANQIAKIAKDAGLFCIIHEEMAFNEVETKAYLRTPHADIIVLTEQVTG